MKNTKRKILDTAKRLFNEFGYRQVTIRMIATELSMSSGNLNYHFKKREDILEAIYFEMVEVFDARVNELGEEPISLQYIQSNIESSMARMIDYSFFWTDIYLLLKSNKKIRDHFENVKSQRQNGYKFVFKSLISADIMKKPSFPNEYIHLSERMINYSNTWLYASLLYTLKGSNNSIIRESSFQLLSMTYSYLTNKGQKEFRNIYPSFFE